MKPSTPSTFLCLPTSLCSPKCSTANTHHPRAAPDQLLKAAFSNRFAKLLGSDLYFSTVYQHFSILHNHHPQNWLSFVNLDSTKSHSVIFRTAPLTAEIFPLCKGAIKILLNKAIVEGWKCTFLYRWVWILILLDLHSKPKLQWAAEKYICPRKGLGALQHFKWKHGSYPLLFKNLTICELIGEQQQQQ